MSSVVRRSLKKETSTLGEIVSLNYIKVKQELGCMMVVKEIENGLLKEVEKLEWWFEQDIDDEGDEDEEDEGGGEV
ncbi:hypothetical protein Tco_0004344 [Tanacetum coccineum]